MFGAACDSVLTTWSTEAESSADYIEAYQYTDNSHDSHDFRTGHLSASQISRWINRPAPTGVAGGFRLLICERQQYSPLDFPITQADFKLAESVFHLPASTLAIFDSDAGSFSQYLQYMDPLRTELKRVGVVLKAPQKREIANWALSCSYDVSTRVTTGLMYGTNAPCFDEHVPNITFNLVPVDAEEGIRQSRESAHRPRSTDVSPSQLILSAADGSAHGEHSPLLRSLKDSQSAWSHPLLLPCTILTEHMRRAKHFCNVGKVMQETWAIEGELGVTYIGRWLDKDTGRTPLNLALEGRKISPFTSSRREQRRTPGWQAAQSRLSKSGIIGRQKAEELTVRINTQSLRILFTARSPQWNSQCSQAMRDLMDKLAASLHHQLDVPAHDGLRELLDYNISTAESVGSHVASMKERMALQLDVLYSMVAQMDNRLSARLAASAGRDSTSMKILAFITALYLPAQAVATVLGMSMFAWPHSGGGNAGGGGGSTEVSIVSDWFWVYWAVTVPLTVITLGGWAAWWFKEMQRFKTSYAEALGEADQELTGSDASSRKGDEISQVPTAASNIKEQELRRAELRSRMLRRKPDEEQGASTGTEKANGL